MADPVGAEAQKSEVELEIRKPIDIEKHAASQKPKKVLVEAGAEPLRGERSKCADFMTRGEDIMMAWSRISISYLDPPIQVLSEVSGYVQRGGVTAIVGASNAGKTLLMHALTGRVESLEISGQISLDGRPIDVHKKHPVTYVPQGDLLIGDLTAREVFTISAKLRRAEPEDVMHAKVEKLLDDLGLLEVADNQIGTVLRRGLSGGQKRRVSVGVELTATSSVIFLDEPTSGLDASTAYTVMETIRNICRASRGMTSVVLSIHQPNSRLLELFDRLLVLGQGGMVYFGSVPGSLSYFSSIGFPVPEHETPTDFYLQLTDRMNPPKGVPAGLNFPTRFNASPNCQHLDGLVKFAGDVRSQQQEFHAEPPSNETGFFKQYWTLTKRNFTLSRRDLTLYYVQMAVYALYGFLIGATFWDLKFEVSNLLPNTLGGITWLQFLAAYVQVFKIHYLQGMKKTFLHEKRNDYYTAGAYWSAEVTQILIMHTVPFPGIAIAYFMLGLPAESFGLVLFVAYILTIFSEALMALLMQFFSSAAYAIVAGQGVLVVMSVFTSGVFMRWDETPPWWVWLQELAFFTHSSRTSLIAINKELTYTCPAANVVGGACKVTGLGDGVFQCDVLFNATGSLCEVSGSEVMDVYKGIDKDSDEFESLGILIALTVIARLFLLVLYYFPPGRILRKWRSFRTPAIFRTILRNDIKVRRLEGQIDMLQTRLAAVLVTEPAQGKEEEAATCIQKWYRKKLLHEHFVPKEDRLSSALSPRPQGNALQRRAVSLRTGEDDRRLVWKDITLTLPKTGKVLLNKISGYAEPGRLLALMGPSGAGKTTLLNALSARAVYAEVTGQVVFGNEELTRDQLSFVPQFDDINDRFTVVETLTWVCRMKCKGLAEDQIFFQVHELINILGLDERQNEKLSALTGGERKKVSVGIGLISKPRVLFLDEPTTGLDSAAAYNIVSYVSKAARSMNVVVIMTIHQPSGSVFRMMDDLVLLESGNLAFSGTLHDAEQYFASMGLVAGPRVNPADFFLDLVFKPAHEAVAEFKAEKLRKQKSRLALLGKEENKEEEKPEEKQAVKEIPEIDEETNWTELYLKHELAQDVKGTYERQMAFHRDVQDEQVSETTRFFILLKKMLLYYSRQPGLYILRSVELILVALFIGTMFLRLSKSTEDLLPISGALFYNIWCVLFAVLGGVPTMCEDRAQTFREHLNGQFSVATWSLAQFTASLPYTFVSSVIYQAIFHYLVGFNDSFDRFVYSILVTMALQLFMEAVIWCFVQLFQEPMLSVMAAMVQLGAFFLFAGFFIKVDDMVPAVRWMPWLMTTKYAFEGSLENIFTGQDYFDPVSNQNIPGKQLIEFAFEQTDIKKWLMFVVLLLWVIGMRCVHLCQLLWESKRYSAQKVKQPSRVHPQPEEEKKEVDAEEEEKEEKEVDVEEKEEVESVKAVVVEEVKAK